MRDLLQTYHESNFAVEVLEVPQELYVAQMPLSVVDHHLGIDSTKRKFTLTVTGDVRRVATTDACKPLVAQWLVPHPAPPRAAHVSTLDEGVLTMPRRPPPDPPDVDTQKLTEPTQDSSENPVMPFAPQKSDASEITERIQRAALAHDSQQNLKRGIAADVEYLPGACLGNPLCSLR